METIKRILVSAMALMVLGSLTWASPGESKSYREFKGRVESFNPQTGFIVVNGMKLTLARNVLYEYGHPAVGDFVELKATNQQGGLLIYKIEVKQRSSNGIRSGEQYRSDDDGHRYGDDDHRYGDDD